VRLTLTPYPSKLRESAREAQKGSCQREVGHAVQRHPVQERRGRIKGPGAAKEGNRAALAPAIGADRWLGVRAAPVKFEAESATSGMHKWVAPDGP
jgi:hypothetical protein